MRQICGSFVTANPTGPNNVPQFYNHPHLGEFTRSAHAFAVCIRAIAGSLINCGERFRSDARISGTMRNCVVLATA